MSTFRTVRKENQYRNGIKRRETNWIGHIWRRNCTIKHFIERKMEEWIAGKRRKKKEAATGRS
jgi:hypothetical protein